MWLSDVRIPTLAGPECLDTGCIQLTDSGKWCSLARMVSPAKGAKCRHRQVRLLTSLLLPTNSNNLREEEAKAAEESVRQCSQSQNDGPAMCTSALQASRHTGYEDAPFALLCSDVLVGCCQGDHAEDSNQLFVSSSISCRLESSRLQCFDLDNFIDSNQRVPAWKCPICSGTIVYQELRIDRIIANVSVSPLMPRHRQSAAYRLRGGLF
jgi:hypothetical protein